MPRPTEDEIRVKFREGDIVRLETECRRLRALAWDAGDPFGALREAALLLEKRAVEVRGPSLDTWRSGKL